MNSSYNMPPRPDINCLTAMQLASRAILTSLMLVAILCCNSAVAQSNGPQLKVVERIWGFDGRVQPGQFNPMSVLLDNQTDADIDATITLQQLSPRLSAGGAQYTEKVYLAATGRRWVQFYPYIAQGYQTEWKLTIDDGELLINEQLGQTFTQARAVTQKDTPQDTVIPQVIILDVDNSTTRPTTVKHLLENIFPPYATATSGLHTVFLDHVPDWELPRQQAFMSWLKLGGRLHLLQNGRGEFPRFSGPLGELNQPLNRYEISNGTVTRHPIRRDALSESMVRQAMVIDSLKAKDTEAEKELREQYKKTGQGLSELIPIDASSTDDELFRGMRELTRPNHAWWLIFLLALSYIGLIFPGCFWVSKRKGRGFIETYGAIIGLAIVFSVLFLIIGRRGYGEATNLQTLAIAKAEDASHWSVFQWNALFVTSGDNYSATAPDQQIVLSIADADSNNGSQITPGNSGKASMQIPPYSSQAFVSRRRVTTNPWKLAIKEINIQLSGMVSLRIDVGENFPINDDTQYMVLVERSLYEMRYTPTSKELTLFGARRRLATYCQPRYDYDRMNPWGQQQKEVDKRSEDEIFFDDSLPQLIQRSLIDDLVDSPANFELPKDRIRLFVYTPVPDDFDLTISASAKRSGRILFCKDLSLNGAPAVQPQ